jgi:predicted RNA-binding protein with PIN domain
MIELPNDVAMTLVRAVGAYLRAMPAQELPPKLRRFQSYRPQGLSKHKDDLLAALDDDALRARIAEWLEKDKPKIPRAEAQTLRVAVEQRDGWKGELLAKGVPSDSQLRRQRSTTTDKERLEAEREKVRKARDEARKAKEEARSAVTAEKAKTAELADQVKQLTRRVAELERSATSAAKESERALDRVEREARKSKSSLDRAVEERDRAKDDAKQARREAMAARRDVTRLEQEISILKKRVTSGGKKTAAPKERKALPVPKGRLEDAKETLSEWLSAPRVHVLIDGYNVAKAEGGFGSLSLEEQRDQLVKAAGKLAHRVAGRTIVVFDGSKVAAGLARRSRSRVEVEYSRPDEIADDHIVALLEKLPRDPVIMVTNDKELQRRARRLGATIATSKQLLALIR